MDDEPKKNYYGVYGVVIVLYIVMITVYAIVVHKATENGAADNVPCIYDAELNPDCPHTPENSFETFLATVFNMA